MANGNGTGEQLQRIERAILGVQPRPHADPEQPAAGTIAEFAEADARLAEALAKYFLEHGQYQHDICVAYAKRKRAEAAELGATLEASDRRRTDEREKLIGSKTAQ